MADLANPNNPSSDSSGDNLSRLLVTQLEEPWYHSLFVSIREIIHPPKLPPLELTSKSIAVVSPDIEELWYHSLIRNVKDIIHPPKLAPLDVTSKPVPVKDIWGLYGRQKKSFILSTGFQVALVAVVVLVGLTDSRVPRAVGNLIQHVYLDTAPADVPRVHPSAKTGGGRKSFLTPSAKSPC